MVLAGRLPPGDARHKARSASASRPRSHSAAARSPWAAELSSRSPSPSSARACGRTRPCLRRHRGAGRESCAWSAISAGTFPSMLAALPTDGSNGSSTAGAAPASARSAASSGGSSRLRAAERWRPATPAPATAAAGTGPARRAAPQATAAPSPPRCAGEGRVEVLLDQPGRPGSVPGGQGVPLPRHRPAHAPHTRRRRPGAAPRPGRAVAAVAGRGAGRRTGGGSATSRAPHPAAPGTGPPAPPAPASPGYRPGR